MKKCMLHVMSKRVLLVLWLTEIWMGCVFLYCKDKYVLPGLSGEVYHGQWPWGDGAPPGVAGHVCKYLTVWCISIANNVVTDIYPPTMNCEALFWQERTQCVDVYLMPHIAGFPFAAIRLHVHNSGCDRWAPWGNTIQCSQLYKGDFCKIL